METESDGMNPISRTIATIFLGVIWLAAGLLPLTAADKPESKSVELFYSEAAGSGSGKPVCTGGGLIVGADCVAENMDAGDKNDGDAGAATANLKLSITAILQISKADNSHVLRLKVRGGGPEISGAMAGDVQNEVWADAKQVRSGLRAWRLNLSEDQIKALYRDGSLTVPVGEPFEGLKRLKARENPVPVTVAVEKTVSPAIRFVIWDEDGFLRTNRIPEREPFWIEVLYGKKPEGDTKTVILRAGETELDVAVNRTPEETTIYRSAAYRAAGWEQPSLELDQDKDVSGEADGHDNLPGASASKDAGQADLAWFHGGWNVAYRDRALGVVWGRADIGAVGVADRLQRPIDGRVRLRDPVSGDIHALALSSQSMEGEKLVLSFTGTSPPSGYHMNEAAFKEAVGEAVSLPVGAGTVLAAIVERARETAEIIEEDVPQFLRDVTVKLTVPITGEPSPLMGEWSYELSAARLMRQSRAGDFREADKTASYPEAWIRPEPRISSVTDLDMPTRQELAELHSGTQRRGERPIWMRPQVAEEHAALRAEYGPDAHAKLWLRIDGVDLPVQPRRTVEVRFEDDKIIWTGAHRPNASRPQSLDVQVVLKKGIVPGAKILTLNGAEGQWHYDIEPAQARYMRMISVADPDEDIPAGFEFVNDLYLGEIFYVELEYADEPPFDKRKVASQAGKGNIVEYTVAKLADRPTVLRSGPILIDAPPENDNGTGSDSGPAVSGAADIFVPATAGTRLLTAETESVAPSRGKSIAVASVKEYPPSLWEKAMARARACREQGLSETEVANHIVSEHLIYAVPALAVYKQIRWGSDSPVREIRRSLKISLEDHAAAILMRDELVGALDRFADRERRSLDIRQGLASEGDRRRDEILSSHTAVLIASARSVNRYENKGLMEIDVDLPQGLSDLDGSTTTPLATALGRGMETRWFNGNRERFLAYAKRAVAQARSELADRTENSMDVAAAPNDCDVVEILALIRNRDVASAIAQRTSRKLMRPPQAGEPRVPRWKPDYPARAKVASVYLLAQAIKDQEDFASIDTDVAVTIASLPVAVVGGGIGAAGRLGANVSTAARGVQIANWMLDAADAGFLLRDFYDYGEALEAVEFAQGLIGIAGTRPLEAARQEADAAAMNVVMGGAMLGTQAALHGALSGVETLRSARNGTDPSSIRLHEDANVPPGDGQAIGTALPETIQTSPRPGSPGTQRLAEPELPPRSPETERVGRPAETETAPRSSDTSQTARSNDTGALPERPGTEATGRSGETETAGRPSGRQETSGLNETDLPPKRHESEGIGRPGESEGAPRSSTTSQTARINDTNASPGRAEPQAAGRPGDTEAAGRPSNRPETSGQNNTDLPPRRHESEGVGRPGATEVAPRPSDGSQTSRLSDPDLSTRPHETEIVGRPGETELMPRPSDSSQTPRLSEPDLPPRPHETEVVGRPGETESMSRPSGGSETPRLSEPDLPPRPHETEVVGRPGETDISSGARPETQSPPPSSNGSFNPIDGSPPLPDRDLARAEPGADLSSSGDYIDIDDLFPSGNRPGTSSSQSRSDSLFGQSEFSSESFSGDFYYGREAVSPVKTARGTFQSISPASGDGRVWKTDTGALLYAEEGALFGKGGYADVTRLLDEDGNPSGLVLKHFTPRTGKFGFGGERYDANHPLTTEIQRKVVEDSLYGQTLLKEHDIPQVEIVDYGRTTDGAYMIQRQIGHPDHLPEGVRSETILGDRLDTGRRLNPDENQAVADLFQRLDETGVAWEDPNTGNIFLREMDDGSVVAGIHDTDRIGNWNDLRAQRDEVLLDFMDRYMTNPNGKFRSMPPGGISRFTSVREFNNKMREAKGFWTYQRELGFAPGILDMNTIQRQFPDLPEGLPQDWRKWVRPPPPPGDRGDLGPFNTIVPFMPRAGPPVAPPERDIAVQMPALGLSLRLAA